MRELGITARGLTAVGSVRHLFTHRDLTAEVFDASISLPRVRADVADERWVQESRLHEIAVSSLLRKQLALKGDKGRKSP